MTSRPRKKTAVTIQDVARSSGVSVSTVSRVLNGKCDVAYDTQSRILDVIRQLGYTSNLAARSMRTRTLNLVGLVMPDIAGPFAVEVMKGVNRAISESDYDLLVYTTGDVRKFETAAHEQKYVALLNNSITDGVVIVAPVASEFNTDGPIVSVDPAVVNPSYPSIHATNYQGALDAMRYLLGLGHRRIGFIAGRTELESSVRRMKGYCDALAAAGLCIDPALIADGDYTTERAIVCASQLLALENRPTAIFAANDQSAIGVYQVADQLGLRIPEDLSLVGFDNVPEAAFLNLTTVDQFIAQMGYDATNILMSLIREDRLDNPTIKMHTQLVIRGSCRHINGIA